MASRKRSKKPRAKAPATKKVSTARVAKLKERLREAEETLDAIRMGHVDALVVHSPTGEQVFTLKGADHRYRQLVETMNEGALMLAADGTIVYANARFAELIKMPLERMIGLSLRQFLASPWHKTLDALLQAGDGDDAKSEVEIVASDGARIPVYFSATASWDEQRLTCLIATDLSQQKRNQAIVAAEQFAASIIDQAAEGIVVCDLDGQIIRASHAAHVIAGKNPLLQPFDEAFPLRNLDRELTLTDLLGRATDGARVSGVEATLIPPDGNVVDLLLSASAVKNGRGESVGCVVCFSDITTRKRAAEERQRLLERAQSARAEAETANRAKDEFMAMLGHELRNPLAPIVTALKLMALKSSEVTREREVIDRQVKHVVRLVDDLLDVSRITQGKIELHQRPIELASIVIRAIEFASPIVEQREHELTVDVAPTGLLVLGDETRLCQVVSNLLTNAAKYTPTKGNIRIRAFAEAGEIVLRVGDDGMGIAADVLPHVFDTFVQGRRTIDRSEGGLGLGLAIVRSMVALHGGRVAVRSDGLGKGSEFEVRLPALSTLEIEAPKKLHDAPAESFAVSPVDARRILIVDDNADAAELLAESLDALGHRTCVAYDGPTALEAAATFKPDVALLDIGLPVMDGYELARRIRIDGIVDDNVRLIALTGYGQHSDRERSSAAGFDEHLVKPIDINRLESVIRRLTSSFRSH